MEITAGVENFSFFQFKGCFSRFLQINYTIDLNNQLIGDGILREILLPLIFKTRK